jgi:biopolymer transport protein TolR
MARKTTLTSLQQISEINLTPLMDLTFILLITFIITFPLIEQGIPINLPRGDAQEVDQQQMLTLSITADGKLYLDQIATSKEDFAAQMQALGETDPDTVILVRADRELQYGSVMEVIQILNQARISRMALVTESEQN